MYYNEILFHIIKVSLSYLVIYYILFLKKMSASIWIANICKVCSFFIIVVVSSFDQSDKRICFPFHTFFVNHLFIEILHLGHNCFYGCKVSKILQYDLFLVCLFRAIVGGITTSIGRDRTVRTRRADRLETVSVVTDTPLPLGLRMKIAD